MNQLHEAKQDRWTAALELMQTAIEFLNDQGRDADTITLIFFDDEARLVLDRCLVADCPDLEELVRHRGLAPGGNTDLSNANFHAFMAASRICDEYPGEPVAELFFTDGAANRGLKDASLIGRQKRNFYQSLSARPSLWAAGLGSEASIETVRTVVEAACPERPLWTHVYEAGVSDFAREMGEGLAANLARVLMPISWSEPEGKETGRAEYWVATDAYNFVYVDGQLSEQPTLTLECPELLSLCRMHHRLETRTDRWPDEELEAADRRLDAIQTVACRWLIERPAAYQTYSSLWTHVKNMVHDVRAHQSFFAEPIRPDLLQRQQSTRFRMACDRSALCRFTSSSFASKLGA